MWLENILAHAHLWRGSAQIEYSSQKIGTTSMKMVVCKLVSRRTHADTTLKPRSGMERLFSIFFSQSTCYTVVHPAQLDPFWWITKYAVSYLTVNE